MENINTLVDSYYSWLKDNTLLTTSGEYTKITTPFLDRHNDCIELYIKQLENNKFIITDDGYTIDDLEICGFSFNTPKRKELLENILYTYHINNDSGVLSTICTTDNFPHKKHFFIQSILSINDLYYTNKSNVASLFFDDVSNFFDDNNIYYNSNMKVSGKSGFDHNIDFALAAIKKKSISEAFIKVLNSPTKSNTENILFAWNDIKDSRKDKSDMFVILNDIENKVKNDILIALESYEIKPLLWSNKDNIISSLKRTG